MTFAKELREKSTEAEIVLWNSLRSNKFVKKFRRQVPLGAYVVDFCCFSEKLIIELDGEGHKGFERRKMDALRTESLTKMGFRVIRFWNAEVINDIDEVMRKIRMNLTPPDVRRGASLS